MSARMTDTRETVASEPTISIHSFKRLRRGHVVIWRDREVRVVQEGPADHLRPPTFMGHCGVRFLKLRPIGYRGELYQPWTLYGYNDVKHKITGPHLRINSKEIFRLEKARVGAWYNLRSAAREIIAEAKRLLPLGSGPAAMLGCMPTMHSLLSLGAGRKVSP